MAKPPSDPKDIAASKALRAIWDAKAKELGLTQEKASHELGFKTQAGVSHYLNGRTPIGTDIAIRFAALLQVDPSEIRSDINERLGLLAGHGGNDSLGASDLGKERLPAELVKAFLGGGDSKRAAILSLAKLPEQEMATMLLVLQSIAAKYE